MPTFTVTLRDGRQVDIEAPRQPSTSEARRLVEQQLLGQSLQQQPPEAQARQEGPGLGAILGEAAGSIAAGKSALNPKGFLGGLPPKLRIPATLGAGLASVTIPRVLEALGQGRGGQESLEAALPTGKLDALFQALGVVAPAVGPLRAARAARVTNLPPLGGAAGQAAQTARPATTAVAQAPGEVATALSPKAGLPKLSPLQSETAAQKTARMAQETFTRGRGAALEPGSLRMTPRQGPPVTVGPGQAAEALKAARVPGVPLKGGARAIEGPAAEKALARLGLSQEQAAAQVTQEAPALAQGITQRITQAVGGPIDDLDEGFQAFMRGGGAEAEGALPSLRRTSGRGFQSPAATPAPAPTAPTLGPTPTAPRSRIAEAVQQLRSGQEAKRMAASDALEELLQRVRGGR